MNVISISAQARTPGKASARAARRQGNVPCVLYGRHVDAHPFVTSERSLHPLIFTDRTHIVNVSLGDDSWECIVKDVTYHPVTDRPIHVDFQALQAGEKVTLSIPLNFIGVSVGQSKGGSPQFVLNELLVSCFPRDIPARIDIDVREVDIGDSIYLRDLEEEALEFLAPEDQILMTVMRPRAVEEEEEVDEEVEEEEEEEIEE
ncbi:MAG: 50S ribosomal protein L25 [Rhodothermaceae bacterium]|nr:50S ribosomal protein L25 [Rhodothermaceae bacterium]MXZ58022.1 50S ribosomal protein L25 [Rhodothermaceae bacterium]MYB91506.1 50S ribosomal protein L25 [Rhodothermaceae bacterium]MYD69051.1 50S ribosomal protein L25 [Rhodothermaceae bacterium]MYG43617.1 50S ribosomal protein L25 [Rhodothermaceae bacterium]